MTAKRVRVAKIGAAHGLRGEVRLFVDADDPFAVKKLGPLEDESGTRKFKIAGLREANGSLLARFEGINDRTAAGRLTNLELFVARDRFPKQRDKSRYYKADLVGLRAETVGGESLGKVVAVPNYGAGDLLEIAPAKGGATFLLPFANPFVPEVDLDGGRVVLDPPHDFFEEPSKPSRTESNS